MLGIFRVGLLVTNHKVFPTCSPMFSSWILNIYSDRATVMWTLPLAFIRVSVKMVGLVLQVMIKPLEETVCFCKHIGQRCLYQSTWNQKPNRTQSLQYLKRDIIIVTLCFNMWESVSLIEIITSHSGQKCSQTAKTYYTKRFSIN